MDKTERLKQIATELRVIARVFSAPGHKTPLDWPATLFEHADALDALAEEPEPQPASQGKE